mgnify:CR=1 FL=1
MLTPATRPAWLQALSTTWQDIHICAWCMPRNIPGTHGICARCMARVLAEVAHV